MNQELEAKLKAIRAVRRGIQPDSAWVRKTRSTLLMQVGNSMPAASASFAYRSQQAWRALVVIPKRISAALRGPTLTILSVIGVVAGGSIASVSAAERAVPGDLLYSVKLATEQTQLAFAGTTTDKLKLKTEFVERRAQEIKDIVSSDVTQKPQRIQEATEILKRDLDTVKGQLNDVSQQDSPHQTAQAAKLLDQKSSELVTALKNVKTSVPESVQPQVGEAEAAAVNVGVKAVQVLLDASAKPDGKDVVTKAEIIQSIDVKVQGLQDTINDAQQQLLATKATSTLPAVAASSSSQLTAASTGTATSSLADIKDAQASLTQAKQLVQQNKLDQVPDKLLESSQAVASAQQTISVLVSDAAASSTAAQLTASSKQPADVGGSATGTVNGTAASSTTASNASSSPAVSAPSVLTPAAAAAPTSTTTGSASSTSRQTDTVKP